MVGSSRPNSVLSVFVRKISGLFIFSSISHSFTLRISFSSWIVIDWVGLLVVGWVLGFSWRILRFGVRMDGGVFGCAWVEDGDGAWDEFSLEVRRAFWSFRSFIWLDRVRLASC